MLIRNKLANLKGTSSSGSSGTFDSGELVTYIQQQDIYYYGQTSGEIAAAVTALEDYADAAASAAVVGLASESWVTGEIASAISDLATETYVSGEIASAITGLATEDYADSAASAAVVGLATEAWVTGQLPSGDMGDQVSGEVTITGGRIYSNTQRVQKFTAGESVIAKQVCYMGTAGKMFKTDADAEATSKGLLAIALNTLAISGEGLFLLNGDVSGEWSWTPGDTLYLHTSSGELTATQPSGSGDIVRIAGYALSATRVLFDPDKTYVEV